MIYVSTTRFPQLYLCSMTQTELQNLFPSLEKELVVEIVRVGEVREIKAGEVIIRSGQNIRSAMLVTSGLIKVYRQDDDGNEYFMYYIDAGKACAISLVCALGVETSGLTARAVTDSSMITIPVNYVSEWMGKYKNWAQFTVLSYRERFEELLQAVDHIAFRSMDERLVFYLKRYLVNTKSNIITTSFTEIAQELNSSREVISRLMKQLSDKHIVRLHRSYVEILDIDKALS